MKAARLAQGVIQIQDLPTPTPKHEEAFIRMRSAGVCHSDLHIARGDWSALPNSMPLSHIGRTAALSEISAVFDDLEAGRYVGRAVLTDFSQSGGRRSALDKENAIMSSHNIVIRNGLVVDGTGALARCGDEVDDGLVGGRSQQLRVGPFLSVPVVFSVRVS